MLPWSADLAGRIDEQVITSELLRANPLGELFEASHMAIDYRYPLSLAWLCQRIAP
jgi:hypothetical protein